MRSHFSIGSGAAKLCAVSSATAMLTGVCSAQIAADSASNPTYATGWSAGQNGGYGFGPWSFDGTSGSPIQQGMTYGNSSPYNALGTAWTLYNPNGGLAGGDVASAGRSFAALQVGQTIQTVIDNPTATSFYRGYGISLLSGADNDNPGSTAGQRVAAYTFEYFSYGKWFVGDGTGNTGTSLFNTDTAPSGMDLAITLTGANSYQLTMTPLNDPADAYTQDGTLNNSGPIDWIQYQFYNTTSNPNASTDFYISSMDITAAPDETSTLALLGSGFAGLLFLRRRK
jgi:hypothetical protein